MMITGIFRSANIVFQIIIMIKNREFLKNWFYRFKLAQFCNPFKDIITYIILINRFITDIISLPVILPDMVAISWGMFDIIIVMGHPESKMWVLLCMASSFSFRLYMKE